MTNSNPSSGSPSPSRDNTGMTPKARLQQMFHLSLGEAAESEAVQDLINAVLEWHLSEKGEDKHGDSK